MGWGDTRTQLPMISSRGQAVIHDLPRLIPLPDEIGQEVHDHAW